MAVYAARLHGCAPLQPLTTKVAKNVGRRLEKSKKYFWIFLRSYHKRPLACGTPRNSGKIRSEQDLKQLLTFLGKYGRIRVLSVAKRKEEKMAKNIDGVMVLLGAAGAVAVVLAVMVVFGLWPALVEMNAYMALG